MECQYQRPDGQKCQFGFDEQPAHFNGKYYCIWHLPYDGKRKWSAWQREEFQRLLADRIDNAAKGKEALDLVGVVLNIPLSVRGLVFYRVDLRGARVVNELDCRQITVHEAIIAQGLVVKDKASFDNATLGSATFVGATFQGPVSFHELKSEGAIDFDDAVFHGYAVFTGATFSQRASFKNASFKVEASFYLANFLDSALFNRAIFEGATPFDEAKFSKRASFVGATFKTYVEFKDCVFLDHTDFRDASFSSHVGFARSIFAKAAIFSVIDSQTAKLPDSSWAGAVFKDAVSFENREFSTKGDFSGAEFNKAPNFHGCAFHEAMVFPIESAFRERGGDDAAKAYRTLRLAMEKLSARIEVGQFFALEQDALRNTPGRLRRNEWLMSWAYAKLSDYGRNALKPLIALIVALFLCAGIYACVVSPEVSLEAKVDHDLLWRSLVFSIQQVAQPFWVWRQPTETILVNTSGSTPLYVALIATIQSVFALVLISLSLLSIRWRFKRE